MNIFVIVFSLVVQMMLFIFLIFYSENENLYVYLLLGIIMSFTLWLIRKTIRENRENEKIGTTTRRLQLIRVESGTSSTHSGGGPGTNLTNLHYTFRDRELDEEIVLFTSGTNHDYGLEYREYVCIFEVEFYIMSHDIVSMKFVEKRYEDDNPWQVFREMNAKRNS